MGCQNESSWARSRPLDKDTLELRLMVIAWELSGISSKISRFLGPAGCDRWKTPRIHTEFHPQPPDRSRKQIASKAPIVNNY